MFHVRYKRFLFFVIWLILIGVGQAAAQDNITLRGYIAVLNSDPPPGSTIPPQQIILLQNRAGQVIAQLLMDYDTALRLRDVEVQVSGGVTAVQGAQTAQLFGSGTPLAVTAVQATHTAPNALPAAPAISGSHPWINILCQFQDDADVPHAPNEYSILFGSSYPGIDHYWRQTSYNMINIAGTTTDTIWRVMPHPRSYYAGSTSTTNADLDALFNDCVRLADPYINFASYDGINMMFSNTLDCCAWGGSYYATLDNQNRLWSVTWLPPWAQKYSVITHEMGHGFGLSHSSGPSINPPGDLNVYISKWDVMSVSGGTCSVSDITFGCIPPGTISYSLYRSGWIPANRLVTVNPGSGVTVTLERLQQPQSSTNYLMAKIPINGSSTHYYTVEARFLRPNGEQNYDQNIPDSAVIIHDVLQGRGGWPGTNTGPALVVVDNPYAGSPSTVVNDENARWKPGEAFYDADNDILISVISQQASSFTVTINNQLPGAPILRAPVGGVSVTNAAPVMSWNAVKRAAGYEIQIDTTNTFTSGAALSEQTTSAGYTAPVLAGNRLYYWRVRTRTTAGTYSDWSAVAQFKLDSAAAAAPQRVHFTTRTPVLTWNRILWANGYKIEVSRATSFSNIASSKIVDGANTLSSSTDPLALGLYYWRVCPRRSDNTFGPCSAADSFVINVP